MMTQVPNADVVVTNPTHYAVALKYDPDKAGAPIVIAKGMNLIAANIRELARDNNVPILEAPPLARALYAHCELEQQIPAALYTVVAEVMAYVFQLNHWIAEGGLPPRPRDQNLEPRSEQACPRRSHPSSPSPRRRRGPRHPRTRPRRRRRPRHPRTRPRRRRRLHRDRRRGRRRRRPRCYLLRS
jgi:flagellar biosynthetic protein FlhB